MSVDPYYTQLTGKSADPEFDLYDHYFLDKLGSLRNQLENINKELETRQTIHIQHIGQIDSQIFSDSLILDQMKHWQVGYKMGVDMERNLWERQIASLLKEKRSEITSAWKDSLSLKESRRELLKEYEELVKRRKLLR
jgi:hypothetical protein